MKILARLSDNGKTVANLEVTPTGLTKTQKGGQVAMIKITSLIIDQNFMLLQISPELKRYQPPLALLKIKKRTEIKLSGAHLTVYYNKIIYLK